MIKIIISKDFSEIPGPRLISEGEYSGEAFREKLLIPKYKEAIQNGEQLIIDLDGGYGFPTSFLEESFGGLARRFDPAEVKKTLSFISNDEPTLVDEIQSYIDHAKDER